jgi:hypothetical protein
MRKKACDWIECSTENYMASNQKYIQDDEKRAEMVSAETETRLSLENREISEDIDVFIKAGKFKFKRDMDMYRKMN